MHENEKTRRHPAEDMQRLQLIVFDLDGTLVDSRKDIAESTNEMLRQLALEELEEETIINFVGRGVRNLVESSLAESLRRSNGSRSSSGLRVGTDGSVSSREAAGTIPLLSIVLPLLRNIYEQHLLVHTKLYPGVIETLLHFSTIPRAVCSNKPQEFSERILEGLGVSSYFSRVLGGDTLPRQKPYPDPLLALVSEFAADPSATLMVGDGID